MKKIYCRFLRPLVCAIAFLFCLGHAANGQKAANTVPVPSSSQTGMLLPVKKGDLFTAQADVAPLHKRHFFGRAFGVLGIAAATYQTHGAATPQSKLVGTNSRPYLVPGIGLGLCAVAMEVFGGRTKGRASLRYAFYNKDTVPVASGSAGSPKKGMLQVRGIAPVGGFVRVWPYNTDDAHVTLSPKEGPQ